MPTAFLRFENFELDRGAYQLRRDGRAVHLERIPLDLLFFLVERRDQLVTREEILERIWGKGLFLDSANSINAAVRKIRRALGDDADAPRYLVTVPAKGYRFVGKVLEAHSEPLPAHPKPSSFVGRERELDELRTGLATTRSSDGRLFLISGEPGIGKTRLTEELAALARIERKVALIGHCI